MKKAAFIGFLALIFALTSIAAYGTADSGMWNRRDSLLRVHDSRIVKIHGQLSVWDVKTPACEVEKLLFQYHDSGPVPTGIIHEITERKQLVAKDSLLTAELFWVLKPFISWLQYIDPHLRIEPYAVYAGDPKRTQKQADNLMAPGFRLLNIGDTLIVDRSVDPLFECGDRILAINDVPASEYLKYSISDRCVFPLFLMKNYYYKIFAGAGFKISLVRNGSEMEITTTGIPWAKSLLHLSREHEFYTKIFPEAKAGYFSIAKFYPSNKLLINKLRKAILQAKRQGCDSFILDLRGNPGGNGSAFDKLLSIFIDKPVIPYLKGQKVWVTRQTVHEYDFLMDSMIGRFVEMPDKYINKEVPLDKKMYIPGFQYYILMNKDTGSVAASFCNIMQFNNAAKLVGEPLLHNAMKYGEVVDGDWLGLTHLRRMAFSTMEFDEYTKAQDGILVPDIAISYLAADYLSGKDAMLDKLLNIISKQNNN